MRPLLLLVAVISCEGEAEETALARQAIASHGCTSCHEVPDVEGHAGATGPPLTHMPAQVYVAGVVPNTPEALVAFILDPQAIDPRSAMPNLAVTEAEAWAIARFLLERGGGG